MLQVLTPKEVIEHREKLLAEMDEALLGDPAKWQGEFPDNFELYNLLRHIFEFWKRPSR